MTDSKKQRHNKCYDDKSPHQETYTEKEVNSYRAQSYNKGYDACDQDRGNKFSYGNFGFGVLLGGIITGTVVWLFLNRETSINLPGVSIRVSER